MSISSGFGGGERKDYDVTDFEPIIRHCDMCGKDMSIHSLADNYLAAIGVGDQTLCGDCFCIHTNTEPITIDYTPHHIVWPDAFETVEDDEDYDNEEIAADEPTQLEMFT